MGNNGEQVLNHNGEELLDFVAANALNILNSFFQNKNIHKCTWVARGSKSIIEYVIKNRKIPPYIKKYSYLEDLM